MARRKPVFIDNEVTDVAENATIADVVSPGTQSVVTNSGELITRDRFSQVPVPPGFETNLTTINKGGASATQVAVRLQPIVIDGVLTHVPHSSTLASLVPADASSIVTDQGELVTRDRFNQVPVPAGFETNLTAINKGMVASVSPVAWLHLP